MSSPIAIIDKLAFGGNGVCRIEGKVCFVPFSCPGDEVRLKITSHKKSYCTAEIIELISPSPYRTIPACPIHGSCGGCNWQHISYKVQLEQKRQIFADTLWRGARVENELIRHVVAAPECYGYRSRVQFKLAVQQGKLKMGFFRLASHIVEDITEGCPVAVPLINEMFKRFRAVLADFPELEAIPQFSIDEGENGLFGVVHFIGSDLPKIRSFLICRKPALMPCSGLFLQAGQNSVPELLWGDSEISYSLPGSDKDVKSSVLTYRPGGFAQVNRGQNVSLLHVIRMLGKFSCTENLLDLYCGNGNFSLPLAADVASVVGVEGCEDSIISVRHNCSINKVINTEFICGDVRSILKRFIGDGRKFDVVLLDPPRTGAGDAVTDIARLNPGRIIYVSCDPSTLARDCGVLAANGYRVAESVPLDMFPQTYHLESATLLCKI